jgi:hypothetical protein
MNRLLSAAWLVRRKGYEEAEDLVREGFGEEEAKTVVSFIVDDNYSHEEFYEELKKLGISDRYTVAC